MSEFVQGALVAGSFALASAFATQMFSLLLEKRREDASYRVNLYDRRLAVHQQGYKWLMDLIEPLRGAMRTPAGDHEKRQLTELGLAARDWWDANCLYLDPASRVKLVDFIEDARSVGEGSLPDGVDPIKRYRDALRAVEEGIGMKHVERAAR